MLLSGCGGKSDSAGHAAPKIDIQATPTPSIYGSPLPRTQGCPPVPHASEELKNLNQFWKKDIKLCRIFSGNNAFAHRERNTVYADQEWLDLIAQRYGSFAATGVLAHEWGHIVQGNVPNGTAAELQADSLAGVHFRAARVTENILDQFLAANFYSGDASFTLNGHGTSDQRVRAVRRGFYNVQFGMHYDAILQVVCPYTPHY